MFGNARVDASRSSGVAVSQLAPVGEGDVGEESATPARTCFSSPKLISREVEAMSKMVSARWLVALVAGVVLGMFALTGT